MGGVIPGTLAGLVIQENLAAVNGISDHSHAA
jgi:hypothetical protein